MTFTATQNAELQKPLDRQNVKGRKQSGRTVSYVEGWHVIAEANRIFGFDGWTRETVELQENTPPTKNSNGNHVVSFRAKVRVTAHSVVREGIGFGSGIASDIHDAYESAVKEAETDAMKRALMTFGNPFGLALYDKTQANVADGETEELKAPPVGLAFQSHQASIRGALTLADLRTAFDIAKADKSLSKAEAEQLVSLKNERKAAIEQPPARNLGEHLDRLHEASN